jgi:hypothetical protein
MAIKSRMKLDIFDYERPVGIQIFWIEMRKQWLCRLKLSLLNPDI